MANRHTPNDPTVDPRIAATGGRRRIEGRAKSEYVWPGMMALPEWSRTNVHQATTYYGCAKCGQQFKTPHAVYTHIDKMHPATASKGRTARS